MYIIIYYDYEYDYIMIRPLSSVYHYYIDYSI
jgi:hypothetical protein